jgi:hypothetical protein
MKEGKRNGGERKGVMGERGRESWGREEGSHGGERK